MKKAMFAIACVLTIVACGLKKPLANPDNGIPTAAEQFAMCQAGGTLACNLYSLNWAVCNGQIVLPITPLLFNQLVCVGLGYKGAPSPPSSVPLVPAPTPAGPKSAGNTISFPKLHIESSAIG